MFTYITRNYKKKLNPRNEYLTESTFKVDSVIMYIVIRAHLFVIIMAFKRNHIYNHFIFYNTVDQSVAFAYFATTQP